MPYAQRLGGSVEKRVAFHHLDWGLESLTREHAMREGTAESFSRSNMKASTVRGKAESEKEPPPVLAILLSDPGWCVHNTLKGVGWRPEN